MAQRAVFEEPAVLEPTYRAPSCTASGTARSSLFHPEDFSLWKLTGELDAGTELTWGSDHGDEAILVLAGELEADGKRCDADGAILVEAGVAGTVRALQDTHLLHFGPVEQQPPADGPYGPAAVEGRGFHVFDSADAVALRLGDVTYYSDGSCPTCRVAFFTVDRRRWTEPASEGSHKHSESEIIHVLDGTMNVGPTNIPTGGSVAIPGGLRYAFKAPAGLRFVNYRRDASLYVAGTTETPRLESRRALQEHLAASDASTA